MFTAQGLSASGVIVDNIIDQEKVHSGYPASRLLFKVTGADDH